MVVKKTDLERTCFKCKEKVIVKYNYPKKQYSDRNSWEWWTENKENKEKYICDMCLEKLYYKNKSEYLKSVTSPTKRNTLRKYMYDARK